MPRAAIREILGGSPPRERPGYGANNASSARAARRREQGCDRALQGPFDGRLSLLPEAPRIAGGGRRRGSAHVPERVAQPRTGFRAGPTAPLALSDRSQRLLVVPPLEARRRVDRA